MIQALDVELPSGSGKINVHHLNTPMRTTSLPC